jgi:hypothetical protein
MKSRVNAFEEKDLKQPQGGQRERRVILAMGIEDCSEIEQVLPIN